VISLVVIVLESVAVASSCRKFLVCSTICEGMVVNVLDVQYYRKTVTEYLSADDLLCKQK